MVAKAPKVTGLSPKEGPPGTKITIRGENLGTAQYDVIGLTICGQDCLTYVEWQSPSKIIARLGSTPTAGLRGDVIVTTRSGGEGTCTVQFRCIIEPIGPLKESAVWVDESHLMTAGGRNRPTSPSQLHPEDPLGLSDESATKQIQEEELHEIFPEGSGNLLSENFTPGWYLLEKHQNTRFEDLKRGLTCLKLKVNQHKEGPLSFLKSNISSIMECLDVLAALQQAMQKDVQTAGTELTEKLEVVLQKTKQEAESIFHSVLERKEKAEMSRNALAVLQRYRFLFNLPANIEKNIQKGDYDVVINDYARAKSLFHDTQVSIFKKLYQEVELAIEKFRARLAEQLRKLPSTLEDQKKLIKYLASLECPGDPAWDCICNMNSWLLALMSQCRDKHQAMAGEENVNTEMPQVVIFVEDIMSIFSEQFPALWKLGQAYIGGHLYLKEVSLGKQDDKQRLLPRETSLKVMVQDSVQQLCNVVRAALIPHTLPALSLQAVQALGTWPKNQSLSAWLPHVLRTVRNCYGTLLRLDLPEEVLHQVQSLVLDLRVATMASLFIQAADEARDIRDKETWAIEMDDQNGGITQLPLMFENIVLETLQRAHETAILAGPREADVFAQLNVQASIKQHAQGLFQAFIHALQEMPYAPAATRAPTEVSENPCFLTESQRLLVVLSNTAYTSTVILPRTLENFRKQGFPDMTLVIRICQGKFTELGQKLFDDYLEKKCAPVVGSIETSMYAGEFDWRQCPPPQGVSSYIKELIMNMVKVHAEVFSISPPYLIKVMKKLIENVCEELMRLYECVGNFTSNANCQIILDIRALDEIFVDYKKASDKIRRFFSDCKKILRPLNQSEASLVDELFWKYKSSLKLQLMCFYLSRSRSSSPPPPRPNPEMV